MFYHYEIKNINGEEVLLLYMTLKYEFSHEFNFQDDQYMENISSDFIKMNHIPYHGNTIYVVVDGVILKKVNIKKRDYVLDPRYMVDRYTLNLKNNEGKTYSVLLKDYLLSILLSMYSPSFGDEVLKSICILYNTYCFYRMAHYHYINDDTSFAHYIPYQEYQDKYDNFSSLVMRLNHIVDECQCIYLAYENDYILPFIHYCNSGKTLTNSNYPYLTSVKSIWDLMDINQINTSHFSYLELSKRLGFKVDANSPIIISQEEHTIHIHHHVFTFLEFKNILDLVSSEFYIIFNRDEVVIITKGIGNGLGLSLYGASYIEQNGGKYNHILSYYFPSCKIYRYIKELSN